MYFGLAPESKHISRRLWRPGTDSYSIIAAFKIVIDRVDLLGFE